MSDCAPLKIQAEFYITGRNRVTVKQHKQLSTKINILILIQIEKYLNKIFYSRASNIAP